MINTTQNMELKFIIPNIIKKKKRKKILNIIKKMVEILIYQNILRKGFKGRYLRVEIESATINSLQRRPYFGNNYPLPSNGSTKSYFHITKYKKLLSKSLQNLKKNLLFWLQNLQCITVITQKLVTIYKPL